MRELAAAIEVGDAGYRRLGSRLDDFGTRLTVVRLRLVPVPAGTSSPGAPTRTTVTRDSRQVSGATSRPRRGRRRAALEPSTGSAYSA